MQPVAWIIGIRQDQFIPMAHFHQGTDQLGGEELGYFLSMTTILLHSCVEAAAYMP